MNSEIDLFMFEIDLFMFEIDLFMFGILILFLNLLHKGGFPFFRLNSDWNQIIEKTRSISSKLEQSQIPGGPLVDNIDYRSYRQMINRSICKEINEWIHMNR